LISPSSVDLGWFSSDEALDLEESDRVEQTYLQLTKALKELGLEYSGNDLELSKVGDPSSCLRFLNFLRTKYEQSVNRKIAPSAEMMTMTDLHEFKKEGDKIIEPAKQSVTESDYIASDVPLVLNDLEFFQNLVKVDFNEMPIVFLKGAKGSNRKFSKNNSEIRGRGT
jgi:hypothetical protein